MRDWRDMRDAAIAKRRRALLAPIIGEENTGTSIDEVETQDVKAEVVKGVVVEPGDKLILTFSRKLRMEEYHRLREYFHAWVPDVTVLVLSEIDNIALIPGSTQVGEVTIGIIGKKGGEL